MRVLIQIIFLFFLLISPVFSGEPGDLPGGENTSAEEVFSETPKETTEELDVSSINDLLEPKSTDVTLPKNRLIEIFDQYFLAELNEDKIRVIGQCEKSVSNGNCFVVEPQKSSNHFNNYYFYTNANNLVYSIIAFNDKKQGDLNKCKNKILSWKNYFENFDFNEKEPSDNTLNFVLTDAPQQNSLEVFASCYTEKYRDISSSFSIKFFKNI